MPVVITLVVVTEVDAARLANMMFNFRSSLIRGNWSVVLACLGASQLPLDLDLNASVVCL